MGMVLYLGDQTLPGKYFEDKQKSQKNSLVWFFGLGLVGFRVCLWVGYFCLVFGGGGGGGGR